MTDRWQCRRGSAQARRATAGMSSWDRPPAHPHAVAVGQGGPPGGEPIRPVRACNTRCRIATPLS